MRSIFEYVKLYTTRPQVVPYSPLVARALQSVTAAILLGQAVYHQLRVGKGEWFSIMRDARRGPDGNALPPASNSELSWEWDTALTRREQESARVTLKATGILEEKRMGIPARVFYRVDLDKLVALLRQADAHPTHLQQCHIVVDRKNSCGPASRNQHDLQHGTDSPSQSAYFVPSNNNREKDFIKKTTNNASAVKGYNSSPDRDVGPIEEIQIHPSIAEHSDAIRHGLKDLVHEDAQSAQTIVDELAGNVIASKRGQKKSIRNICGWLHHMTQLSRKQAFFPSAGIDIRKQRELEKLNNTTIIQSPDTPDPEISYPKDIPSNEFTRKHVDNIRRILSTYRKK